MKTLFTETEVAAILGIEPEEIGFAIRRGDLRNHDASTIHGVRLWSIDSLLATPMVQQRICDVGKRLPELLHEYASMIRQAFGQKPCGASVC